MRFKDVFEIDRSVDSRNNVIIKKRVEVESIPLVTNPTTQDAYDLVIELFKRVGFEVE